ncbi:alpha/beta fold hydrolase [Oricola sp.]|uniref:alpha/beta fold hydrolase n=1 Tax=Oricola sp. TaxID=1979950 RepID=UPI003BABB0C5
MAIDGVSVFYTTGDGMRLHAVDYRAGPAGALPLICLPGVSRNARDFIHLARHVAGHRDHPRRVIAFDYRGRGLSEWDWDWRSYNILTEAEDILAGMAALGVRHAAIVGTSRGGLLAMALAALRPSVLRGVVLNDSGPVIEGNGIARIAAHLTKLPRPHDWAHAIEIQKAFMQKQFPAFSDADWECEARSRYREINGTILPDHDPALVNTMTSLDLSVPLPTMWPQFDGLRRLPVMVLRGEHSDILSTGTVEKMAERHDRLEVVEVAGQGHAPLLHSGDLPETVAAFLARIPA